MDKKASSLSGWTEGILLIILFIMMFGIVIGGFNSMYSKSYTTGLGVNETKMEFIEAQDTLQSELDTGEVDYNSVYGLNLKSSWAMIKAVLNIVWNFITGGFIETICMWMHLPAEVALIFRMLYFLSLIFFIMYIIFKVKP